MVHILVYAPITQILELSLVRTTTNVRKEDIFDQFFEEKDKSYFLLPS